MYESIESKIPDIVEGTLFKRVGPHEPLLESEWGVEIPAEKIHEPLRTARSLASHVLATHH